MEDASCAMLATPTPKKKAPENADGEEADTVSETDRQTKIDQSEIMRTSQNNAPH